MTGTSFDPAELGKLPQGMGRWELGARPLPEEMSIQGEPGYLLVVLDAHSGRARASRAVPAATDDALLRVLFDAMTRARDQSPCRPRQLAVETSTLQSVLAGHLEQCGIDLLRVPMLPLVDDFMESLREQFAQQAARSPIGALVLEKPLAEAAAQIAALEPWRLIPGELPLQLTDDQADGPARILVVMGQERTVEGIAAYDDEKQFQRAHAAGQPLGSWCLLFHRAFEVPQDVRDELEQLGLPVEHQLYPHYAVLPEPDTPEVVDNEQVAQRILGELEALQLYLKDCGAALSDGRQPRRTGLKLSDGRRMTITARLDLLPVGSPEDDDWQPPCATAQCGHGEHTEEHTIERPRPAVANDLEEPAAEALPDPEDLQHVAYRIVLCTLPTAGLTEADGAGDALQQAELWLGELPSEMPAIVLKMSKADALQSSDKLAEVNRASFRQLTDSGLEFEQLVLCADERDEVALERWPLDDDKPPPSAFNHGTGVDDGALLLFVSGGANRPLETLPPSAIVGGQYVEVARSGSSEPLAVPKPAAKRAAKRRKQAAARPRGRSKPLAKGSAKPRGKNSAGNPRKKGSAKTGSMTGAKASKQSPAKTGQKTTAKAHKKGPRRRPRPT